jgi:hypothetical protein
LFFGYICVAKVIQKRSKKKEAGRKMEMEVNLEKQDY